MISYAIKDNNLKKINLEVRESNKIAIEFYQKMNFKNPQTIQMAQELLQIANDYIKSKI